MIEETVIDPATYDSWYCTPRGRWIGMREAALLLEGLQPRAGESLLDVGCGTGWFTRALGGATGGRVVGADVDPEAVRFARGRDASGASYEVADARALPHADASFDLVVSVAALCFITEEAAAAREIVRVARRRFAVGLLHRPSLLWLDKGRHGGSGGYRGARWHTAREARRLFHDAGARRLRVRTAIHLPGGGTVARAVERLGPRWLPTGGFLLVCGEPPGLPPGGRAGEGEAPGGQE